MRTIQNGYPAEKIVVGMMSGNFPSKTSFDVALTTIKNIKKNIEFWRSRCVEYFDSPPGNKNNPANSTRYVRMLDCSY